MNSRRAFLPAICVLLAAHPLQVQAQTRLTQEQRGQVFDRLDRSSRDLLSTVRCAISTAQARARGQFGPVDSLGGMGMCLERNGSFFGLFLAADTGFTKAVRLSVVDLVKGVRDTQPVDTAAILAQARATRAGVLKGAPTFQRERRQYAPFSMRSDGDSIEVWLLPTGLLLGDAPTTLGGERGFIFSPDGQTIAREIDASQQFRSITIPATGPVELLSQEDDVPLFSELVAVNILHSKGREVALVTKSYRSQLVGREPNSFWVHSIRK